MRTVRMSLAAASTVTPTIRTTALACATPVTSVSRLIVVVINKMKYILEKGIEEQGREKIFLAMYDYQRATNRT